MPAWRNLPLGAETPKVGSTLAQLGTGANGQMGILRLGTWPNLHELYLTYNTTTSKWVSDETVLTTQSDSWAMDLGNRSGTNLLDWSLVVNVIPYGKVHTVLNGSHDLSTAAFTGGTGVLTVSSTTSPKNEVFASSGTVLIRDNVISYTGTTATTFTGCTATAGTRGTIPSTVDVVQGYTGGFGMVASTLPFVTETWAAGFRLQERLTALMNAAPNPGVQLLSVAPYWIEYDSGDGIGPIPIPVAGGLGLSAVLTSEADPGGAGKDAERSFSWAENPWTDITQFTPTKRYLTPRIAGRMAAGAIDTGEVLDLRLGVRWVG